MLIEDLSFKLPPGGIVGVIGPNGAGKTTLFRMIVGQEKPDAGSLKIGDTVQLAYVDQSPRRAARGSERLGGDLGRPGTLELGKRKLNSRAYVAAFNFKGADQQKRVKDLSGGERNRVHLASMLKSGGNVLLLDEPTNDLDVDTLRALEEALLDFAGCAVVISHDRWFLDRIATHMLAFEGDSQVVWFEGNYQDYEVQRRQRLGAEADQPHRIRVQEAGAQLGFFREPAACPLSWVEAQAFAARQRYRMMASFLTATRSSACVGARNRVREKAGPRRCPGHHMLPRRVHSIGECRGDAPRHIHQLEPHPPPARHAVLHLSTVRGRVRSD